MVQPNASQDSQFLALQQRLQALRQGEPPAPVSPWETTAPPPPDRPRTVATLQHNPTAGIRQAAPPLSSPAAAPLAVPPTPWEDPAIQAILEGLHRKADRINGLAQDQITALRGFKQELDGLDWRLRHRPEWVGWTADQVVSLQAVQVPWVQTEEGQGLQLVAYPVDLYQQEQEASQTAARLRHPRRRSRSSRMFPWAMARPWQGYGRSPMTLWGAIAWGVTGAIARRGLEVLLLGVPGLWPVVVGLLMAGAGWGLYRLLTHPPEEWAAIWRLLLALAGVVLGGYV